MPIVENQSFDPWMEKVDEKEKLKRELREEVVSEIKKKKRGKFFGCCFLKFFIIVLILAASIALLAKTGLFDIPVFSKIFYQAPAPEREVAANTAEEKSFENLLAQKLDQELRSGKNLAAGGEIPVTLEFTEEELTGFLKTAETGEDYPFTEAQISITPQAIEIFGQLKEFNQTFLTVALRPEIKNGELEIIFQKIRIGNLSLPPAIGNFLTDKLLKDQLDSVKKLISENGNLENIELTEGKIIFQGEVATETFTK